MDVIFLQLTPWHWLVLCLFFLVLELLTGGGFLLWIGIAAGLVGVLLWVVPSLFWAWQWVIFGVLTIVSAVAWWKYLQKRPIHTDRPNLNRRSEQYVGREVILEEAIVSGRGRVHLEDTMWLVTGPDMPKGTKVKIVGTDGVLLKVQKVKSTTIE